MSALPGVTFGDKHSYRDWGLLMLNNPVITAPPAQTKYLLIPGSDGRLDLSESLTGRVQYDVRTLTVELQDIRDKKYWQSSYSEVANFLHGQEAKITFDTDPEYYYLGRCAVGDFNPERLKSVITITAICEPYKYLRSATENDWLWDDFSFIDGVIRNYDNIVVNGTQSVVVIGSTMQVSPTITAVISEDNSLTVTRDGSHTYSLHNGDNSIPQIVINSGEQTLTFTGQGTVNINFAVGII